MKKQFNIALVGCGRIGFLLEKDPLRNKPCTHFGGSKASKVNINYACDIDKKRLKLFSQTALISWSPELVQLNKIIVNGRIKNINNSFIYLLQMLTYVCFNVLNYFIKNYKNT